MAFRFIIYGSPGWMLSEAELLLLLHIFKSTAKPGFKLPHNKRRAKYFLLKAHLQQWKIQQLLSRYKHRTKCMLSRARNINRGIENIWLWEMIFKLFHVQLLRERVYADRFWAENARGCIAITRHRHINNHLIHSLSKLCPDCILRNVKLLLKFVVSEGFANFSSPKDSSRNLAEASYTDKEIRENYL